MSAIPPLAKPQPLVRLALLLALACVRCAAAPVPAEAGFLSTLLRLQVAYEPWNQASFPQYGGNHHTGKHWDIRGAINGPNDSLAAWGLLKAAFLAQGWIVQNEALAPMQPYATLAYSQNQVEAWANVTVSYPNLVRVDLLEGASLPYTLVIQPPKSKPELVDPAAGDFPYLPPLPQTGPGSSKPASTPFLVQVRNAIEPALISIDSGMKSYPRPDGLTTALFLAEYRNALTQAGWDIANESSNPDTFLVAHYAKRGRNLWASLRFHSDSYQIQIAEPVLAGPFAKALANNCHALLPGLLFDFPEPLPTPPGVAPGVTLTQNGSVVSFGDSSTWTATTAITAPGLFRWRMVKQKEEDDPTAFKVIASPCPGQATCTATVENLHPGFADFYADFFYAASARLMQNESAPVLRHLLTLLKKRRSLHIEVQAYTDDNGTDAYLNTFSNAQAAAVAAWLTRHGIAANRLTAKGYGSANPIGENSTVDSRALNRRIEIADPRCTPKAPPPALAGAVNRN